MAMLRLVPDRAASPALPAELGTITPHPIRVIAAM
jgi:hypothetical protein